jgi:RHS repeat-associated protein
VYVGETRVAVKLAAADRELETSTNEEGEKQYWYHGDHLGSAQMISDVRGEEYERIEYTPYGEVWIERKGAVSNLDISYRFTGKERDSETGLYYYGARYLDGKTGRWLSTDPALGEYVPSAPVNEEARRRNGNLPGMGGVYNLVNLHVYHYAGNNPVKYTDPDGRSPKYANLLNAINLDFGRDYMVLAESNFREGEYGWAGLMILNAVSEAAYDLLAAYGAASAVGVLATGGSGGLSTAAGSGSTVVGQQVVSKRDTLLNAASDLRLKNLIGNLYRVGAKIGDGGTADAIRYERQTGELLSPSGHFTKGKEMISALSRLIDKGNLNANDIEIARSILTDLNNAISGE